MKAHLLALGLLLFPLTGWAQTYPAKPIRVVLTVSAAGDITVRALAEKMQPWLGQPFIVDVQSAAGGAQGATTVARAAPDGYTLLYGTIGAMVLRQFLVKDIPYNTLKDFVPVARVGEALAGIVVNNDIGVSDLKGLIEYARKNPGKVSYGTTGIGGTHHLSGVVLEQLTGIKWVHVPYKTGPQSAQDLMGGRIPVVLGTLTTYKALTDTNKAKVVAINGDRRFSEMPDVPTVAEVLPGYERPAGWMAFFAPTGTPAPIVRRLEESIIKAASDPAIQDRLLKIGVLVETLPGEKFGAVVKRDIELNGRLIKQAGIEPQ
jgi:tripartite-type tricarboxylate transporter receptor subunit TctC